MCGRLSLNHSCPSALAPSKRADVESTCARPGPRSGMARGDTRVCVPPPRRRFVLPRAPSPQSTPGWLMTAWGCGARSGL
eukprot:9376464-Pyramimonas_sp.AAC.1